VIYSSVHDRCGTWLWEPCAAFAGVYLGIAGGRSSLRGTHIACVYMATYVFREEEESGYEWTTIG
jgi:hypothetical protein